MIPATTNPLPDGQTAFNNLFQGVYQRVFFNKCAAYGFQPRTAEEAQAMLDGANELRVLDQAAPAKQASDSPYFQVRDALHGVMQQQGIGSYSAQVRHQEEETSIKQASAQLAGDPIIYNSVLALKAAEAEEIRQTYQRK